MAGPVAFSSLDDLRRTVAGVRLAEELAASAIRPPVDRGFAPTTEMFVVQIKEDAEADARGYWPADPVHLWADGWEEYADAGPVLAKDVNDQDLEPGRRYRAWVVDVVPSDPNTGSSPVETLVAVEAGGAGDGGGGGGSGGCVGNGWVQSLTANTRLVVSIVSKTGLCISVADDQEPIVLRYDGNEDSPTYGMWVEFANGAPAGGDGVGFDLTRRVMHPAVYVDKSALLAMQLASPDGEAVYQLTPLFCGQCAEFAFGPRYPDGCLPIYCDGRVAVLDGDGQPILDPVLDENGDPVLDDNGDPVITPRLTDPPRPTCPSGGEVVFRVCIYCPITDCIPRKPGNPQPHSIGVYGRRIDELSPPPYEMLYGLPDTPENEPFRLYQVCRVPAGKTVQVGTYPGYNYEDVTYHTIPVETEPYSREFAFDYPVDLVDGTYREGPVSVPRRNDNDSEFTWATVWRFTVVGNPCDPTIWQITCDDRARLGTNLACRPTTQSGSGTCTGNYGLTVNLSQTDPYLVRGFLSPGAYPFGVGGNNLNATFPVYALEMREKEPAAPVSCYGAGGPPAGTEGGVAALWHHPILFSVSSIPWATVLRLTRSNGGPVLGYMRVPNRDGFPLPPLPGVVGPPLNPNPLLPEASFYAYVGPPGAEVLTLIATLVVGSLPWGGPYLVESPLAPGVMQYNFQWALKLTNEWGGPETRPALTAEGGGQPDLGVPFVPFAATFRDSTGVNYEVTSV